MTRYLILSLLTACMTPCLFGCGEEAPIVQEDYDVVEELDPATEAEAQKKAQQENR